MPHFLPRRKLPVLPHGGQKRSDGLQCSIPDPNPRGDPPEAHLRRGLGHQLRPGRQAGLFHKGGASQERSHSGHPRSGEREGASSDRRQVSAAIHCGPLLVAGREALRRSRVERLRRFPEPDRHLRRGEGNGKAGRIAPLGGHLQPRLASRRERPHPGGRRDRSIAADLGSPLPGGTGPEDHQRLE